MAYIGNAPAAGIVNSGNILDGSINTSDLADAAVTAQKLAAAAITDKLGYTPVNKAGDTMTGMLTANQFKNTYSTVLNDFATTAPASDAIILQGTPNDRDCWIYRDPAGHPNNWGIYHRNIDTPVRGAPGNSLIFVGGNVSAGYIGLENKVWGIGVNQVPVYSGGTVTGSPESAANLLWFPAWYSLTQRCTYDRGWNNEPSITVLNDTANGSQANFRIHGAGGPSGGDFSVVVISDGGFVTSDARRKTGIQNITNALDTVKRLQGRKYQYVNSDLQPQTHMSAANGYKFGFVAQEIESIIPEAVKTIEGEVAIPKENGYADGYVVDYGSVVALLTEAIKEQQAIIEQLNTRLSALEAA